MTSDYLSDFLGVLDNQDAAVLVYSFGALGTAKMTQVEIGRMFGMAQQRVSEAKHSALATLRSVMSSPGGL